MYMVLPVLQSTRKECRQDSEDYLNSSHYFSFICMGQIYTLLYLSDIHILEIL